MMNLKYLIIIFLKPIIWLFLMCYGLYLPAEGLPKISFINIPWFDKIVHFGLFFIFCLLLFKPFKKLKFKNLFIAPGISLLMAGFFEITQQAFSASRSSNIYDFAANVAGICASLILYYFFISDKKPEKYI